jgi:transposase InsO family protein
MLQVISLAQYAAVYTRSWAVDSLNGRVRLRAENERLRQEVALLREEIRIKDTRMASLAPQRRPQYAPVERLASLQLRADTFLVTAATIASWMKRVDEEGPDALVQLREPVNKLREFVRYVVQRLKTLCPTMGKRKIAETLARAGLHLGTTTVGRMLKEPSSSTGEQVTASTGRAVTSKYPNNVWNVDLTAVPTAAGFWVSWLPFAVPQAWPFCWGVSLAVDHHSRRVMGLAIFKQEPTSTAIRAFLGPAIRAAGSAPKHDISDTGSQF